MIHCFYHNDMDGHCAGAIVKQKYPEAEMHEVNYGYDFYKEIVPLVPECDDEEKKIFIVDFSFPPENLMVWHSQGWEIHWCDHHDSAIKRAAKNYVEATQAGEDDVYQFVKGLQDTSKAGAQLTWEYLNPGTALPRAVHYVAQWDLWDHTDPNTIPFNRGLMLTESTDPLYQRAMDMWLELFRDSRDGDNRRWNALDQVLSIGTIGEAMKAQYDMYLAQHAYYVADWNGKRTVALNTRAYDSYVIFEHADKWDEFEPEVLIWYYQTKDGRWRHRIRAYPGTTTNVVELAQKYDGGGHDVAAAFISDKPEIAPEVK